jgi:hypothetical protein
VEQLGATSPSVHPGVVTGRPIGFSSSIQQPTAQPATGVVRPGKENLLTQRVAAACAAACDATSEARAAWTTSTPRRIRLGGPPGTAGWTPGTTSGTNRSARPRLRTRYTATDWTRVGTRKFAKARGGGGGGHTTDRNSPLASAARVGRSGRTGLPSFFPLRPHQITCKTRYFDPVEALPSLSRRL